MKNPLLAVIFSGMILFYFQSCTDKNNQSTVGPILDHSAIAQKYFKTDTAWYLENIPFFECSDQQIEQVYYYRWELYKAHIRNIGDNDYVITEFINHVGWDRDPYGTINAASMHHIYEGRWLRDPRYMDGYINYLYQGGNNRSYSESVADASYARYLVNADSDFLIAQLDSMKSIYNQWDDHWEAAKGLYHILAMPDATEFTIASIDASGGTGGFEGGDAFRPTINSYMYGNAMAISRIAQMKGDHDASKEYLQRAESLKSNVEKYLWNDSLHHFTDRFRESNSFVHYWDFIRGRELAGLVPWYFNLPADKPEFNQAWKHITDTAQLLGPYGFRTNEPSYEYYFTQFLYHEGKRGSQWNGPSWPYQTSQVLTAMANVLNDYDQDVITKSDYMHSLRLFTRQHFLPDGKINLVENYDPNIGEPIVHYYWSNHYNHSSYNNLVISGLCGIRPSEGGSLTVYPLADDSIRYFCLEGISYHGHSITLIFDRDGTRYNRGKGLSLFVDGEKRNGTEIQPGKYRYKIGAPVVVQTTWKPNNIALNIWKKGYPTPSSSFAPVADSLYQAIDGRAWFFSEITNGWSTRGSSDATDWFAIDFGQPKEITCIKLHPFSDGATFGLPDNVSIDYDINGQWQPAKITISHPTRLTGNTENFIFIDKVNTSRIRLNFSKKKLPIFLSEIECY